MPQLAYGYDQPAAFDGMLGDIRGHEIESWANAEATAGLFFGRFVSQYADHQAKRLAATTDRIAGVVVHSHADAVATSTTLPDDGVRPKAPINLLREGPFWTKSEGTLDQNSDVYVRMTATGSQQTGAVRGTPDGATCVKLVGARVLTPTTVDGFTQIDIDMDIHDAVSGTGAVAGAGGADVGLVTGADLSGAQYLFVKVDSAGKVVVAGAGDNAIGVLQNVPAAAVGSAAIVRTRGITNVITAGTDAPGTFVESDSAGKAKAAVAGNTDTTSGSDSTTTALKGGNVMGVLLETATANVAHKMLFQPRGVIPTTAS